MELTPEELISRLEKRVKALEDRNEFFKRWEEQLKGIAEMYKTRN